jgi:hypothetical protein
MCANDDPVPRVLPAQRPLAVLSDALDGCLTCLSKTREAVTVHKIGSDLLSFIGESTREWHHEVRGWSRRLVP